MDIYIIGNRTLTPNPNPKALIHTIPILICDVLKEGAGGRNGLSQASGER
jgi:hypothetical protein